MSGYLNPVRHITFDCHDPYRIAEFWAALTGYKITDEDAPAITRC